MTEVSLNNAPPIQDERPDLRSPGSRPRVTHLFDAKALAFAQEYQLSIRTFCGIWQTPGRPGQMSILTGPQDVEARDCKRCTTVWLRRRSMSKTKIRRTNS